MTMTATLTLTTAKTVTATMTMTDYKHACDFDVLGSGPSILLTRGGV